MYLYIYYTNDEYHTPVFIADSVRELASILKRTPESVSSCISHNSECIRRVYVGEDEMSNAKIFKKDELPEREQGMNVSVDVVMKLKSGLIRRGFYNFDDGNWYTITNNVRKVGNKICWWEYA